MGKNGKKAVEEVVVAAVMVSYDDKVCTTITAN